MKQNNLDEMQEQKMLRIEHTCCWLAVWGLLAAILIQLILVQSVAAIAGEAIVLFALCFYLVIDCLRQGLWDRRLKADRKTNLIGSAVGAGGIYLFSLVLGLRLGAGKGIALVLGVSLIPALVVFGLCFGTLTLCTRIYTKRRQKMEQE